MATEAEQHSGAAATSTPPTHDTTQPAITSPARSDQSSDSEGKPVREKLKETRIDAQGGAGPEPVLNGNTPSGEQSASGSDSERGRLRRKRSREDFEDEAEADKHAGKKVEVAPERHARKRSRDISKDDLPPKPAPSKIASIVENDADEQMTSPSKDTTSTTAANTDTSPKNKRTRDQAEKESILASEDPHEATANGATIDERDTKRPRDQNEAAPAAGVAASTTKVPPTSGFANTSAASPFAAMSPKTQPSKPADRAESLPQTADDKFKASGFGTFSSSSASPFGGLASSKPAAGSPFGAASGNKITSFVGSKEPSTTSSSGFGGLGASAKSGFGGTSFGGALSGSGFGGLGSTKPGLSSFGTFGNLEIKGLKAKSDAPFGAAADCEASEDDEGDESDTEKDSKEDATSQTLFSQQPHETGEEGESTVWQGRAKLYTMAGEANSRAWKERGTGVFKFNITVDEPKKARFVLRADGTHRLLLNAAVTKKMVFGGNAQGEKPKDTRLLFNSPTADGEVEMHLLKLKAENAVKLWEEVTQTQKREL
ncbi:hypothetical protein ACN47E_006957 [Coniothyrium glycines]